MLLVAHLQQVYSESSKMRPVVSCGSSTTLQGNGSKPKHPAFLTSALDVGECLISFTPSPEEEPLVRRLCGLQRRSEFSEEEKISNSTVKYQH
jgi:hypothetical protein